MYDLWDEWGQQSDRYNKTKNDKQWDSNQGIIDITYLIWLQGDKTVEPMQTYMVFESNTVDTAIIK